jgi:membrane protein required for colicin V production
MHVLDILFAVVGLISLIIGIRRGMVSELFRFLALVVGFLAAFLFYPRAAAYAAFAPPQLAATLSFITIFIVAALVVLGIGWVIRKIVHLTPLGWIDHLFGGIFGLLKAGFLFWVLCLAFSFFPLGLDKLTLRHSRVYQTYQSLPAFLKPSGLSRLRETLKIGPSPASLHNLRKIGRTGARPAAKPQEKGAESGANEI